MSPGTARPGLPSCSQAGLGTVSFKRFPSWGLGIMHLEQHSLIQVCDLAENQIAVISPAIWPRVCSPRTGGWSCAGGRAGPQGILLLSITLNTILTVTTSSPLSTTPTVTVSITPATLGWNSQTGTSHAGDAHGMFWGWCEVCRCQDLAGMPHQAGGGDGEEVGARVCPPLGTRWQQERPWEVAAMWPRGPQHSPPRPSFPAH